MTIKRIIRFAATLTLFLGLHGLAWALPVSPEPSPVLINKKSLKTAPVGSFSWGHLLPGGFADLLDKLISADLEVTARRATDANDNVSLASFGLLGPLQTGTGNSDAVTSYDLLALGVFADGWEAPTLDLSLAYNQPGGASNTLTLVSSIFRFSYDDGTVSLASVPGAAPAPVPEPSTLLLLGGGLLGLTALRLRKK